MKSQWFLEVNKLVDFCEKCKNYYIGSKPLRGINSNVDYIPQNKCKLNYKIAKNKDGVFVPMTNGYVCKDFHPK